MAPRRASTRTPANGPRSRPPAFPRRPILDRSVPRPFSAIRSSPRRPCRRPHTGDGPTRRRTPRPVAARARPRPWHRPRRSSAAEDRRPTPPPRHGRPSGSALPRDDLALRLDRVRGELGDHQRTVVDERFQPSLGRPGTDETTSLPDRVRGRRQLQEIGLDRAVAVPASRRRIADHGVAPLLLLRVSDRPLRANTCGPADVRRRLREAKGRPAGSDVPATANER